MGSRTRRRPAGRDYAEAKDAEVGRKNRADGGGQKRLKAEFGMRKSEKIEKSASSKVHGAIKSDMPKKNHF